MVRAIQPVEIEPREEPDLSGEFWGHLRHYFDVAFLTALDRLPRRNDRPAIAREMAKNAVERVYDLIEEYRKE
jgi:hypothetical protein